MSCEIELITVYRSIKTIRNDLNMPLTDEQRRRIEENKQKAIEKRRNAAGSSKPQPFNPIPSNLGSSTRQPATIKDILILLGK